MELTLKERILIQQIIPQKGNMLEMMTVKSIAKKIEVTEEESKKFEITQKGNGIVWNKKGTEAKFKIDFSEVELKVLKDAVTDLNNKKEITLDNLELCGKIEKA